MFVVVFFFFFFFFICFPSGEPHMGGSGLSWSLIDDNDDAFSGGTHSSFTGSAGNCKVLVSYSIVLSNIFHSLSSF